MTGPPATLEERRLGTLPWLTVTGPRRACFQALGRHVAHALRTVVETLPQLDALRRRRETAEGGARVAAVLRATAERFPAHVDEITAMADGAGVASETLLLLNLRGDVGAPRAGGCSDVVVPGARWVLGHNEDGHTSFAGLISGLTLHVDGERPVFALWYPGMLPSNAFTLNAGLAWGIDDVPAEEPVDAPGRHAVARALQQVERLDDAVAFLVSQPSAGAFAYNLIERATGRVASVEAGGGVYALARGPESTPILWHTNHLRFTETARAGARPASCARGDVLRAMAASGGEPSDAVAVLQILTTPLPRGVLAQGAARTLCTVVLDGSAGAMTLVAAGHPPTHVAMDDLLS